MCFAWWLANLLWAWMNLENNALPSSGTKNVASNEGSIVNQDPVVCLFHRGQRL